MPVSLTITLANPNSKPEIEAHIDDHNASDFSNMYDTTVLQ